MVDGEIGRQTDRQTDILIDRQTGLILGNWLT